MDAIECGIVKLPRVPVADNLPIGDMPVFRDLWAHIGKDMPKKGRGQDRRSGPARAAHRLITALDALYGHYVKTFEVWAARKYHRAAGVHRGLQQHRHVQAGLRIHSGFTAHDEAGHENFHNGRLELFRNFDDYGNRLPGCARC